MLYFESREQAGKILAAELLQKYRYENCAVVALNDGAVIVGEQIAAALHCILTLLLVEEIPVPGEEESFGGINQDGEFTYNSELSEGERDEYTEEFHGYLEEKKMEAFQRINRLVGDGGLISHDMLKDRVVILVSDGIDNTTVLDVANEFLKPIRLEKLVVAAPVASVTVVDTLHMLADELHILDVKENYMGVNHYYDHNDIPSHEATIAKINQIILNWR